MSRDYTEVQTCKVCQRETPRLIHDAQHERDSSGDHSECLICGSWYDGWGDLVREYDPPITFPYASARIGERVCFVLDLGKIASIKRPSGIVNHRKTYGTITTVGTNTDTGKLFWIVSCEHGYFMVTNEDICRE